MGNNYKIINWADNKEWLVSDRGTKENPLYTPIGRIDRVIKCVNNHDALVELLKYVIKEIETTPDELSDALLGLIKIKVQTALAQVEKG